MNTLVIYNQFTEGTDFYLIPDSEMKPEWQTLLYLAHNKFINNDDTTEAMNWVCNALSSNPEYCFNSKSADNCCLYKYKVDITAPLTAQINSVYYCGFVP